MTIIGRAISQPGGYKAFVPEPFPPLGLSIVDSELIQLSDKATLRLGKLDGITQTLPDLDFFIFMYVRKEAALSSKIEGTQASMVDSIEAELDSSVELPEDVNDILHYIEAMNFGLKKLEEIPLSLRLIREVHKVLMTGARTSFPASPGEFRTSQNWIGGTTLANALFVPPPPMEMLRSLGDLEKFFHEKDTIPSLIKTALAHAQFETIHPFVDGNGRTGRLLITFYLCQQKVLERPVLYLSEFFKRHRELYFDLLNNYHSKGEVVPWFKFFLEGVAEVAEKAIDASKQINVLRTRDIEKIQDFFKTHKTPLKVYNNLFELPIINVKKIEEWTGLSRDSANDLVNKFVKIGVLKQRNRHKEYARTFEYKEYLDIFTEE